MTLKNGSDIEDLLVVMHITNPKSTMSLLDDAMIIGVSTVQSTAQCIACNKG